MKVFKLWNLALLAGLALASSGCLERNFVEDVGVISVNTREIVVPSDLYEGRNLVKDTLYVTSNRNWSVTFEDDVDWVRLDTTGHMNLARISDVTPIVFSFDDNETEAERRVRARISCEDGDKYVNILQEPISYRLELVSSTDGFGSVSSDKTELPLEINCNTAWTAKVMSGNTAVVSFSKSSGKYSASLKAIVAENEEMITKDATIVLSATGCKDIEIPITQIAGLPYIRFQTEEGVNEYTAETAVSDYAIPFKSNTNWQAEIVTLEGYNETEVSIVTSGSKSATAVKVTFPYCCGSKDGKIVVRITGDGVADPLEFTIHQKPGARIWYYNYESKTRYNSTTTSCIQDPPMNTTYFPNSKGSARAEMKGTPVKITLKNGLEFEAYSTDGYWQNSGTGLMFGQAKGDYLKFPAIEGRKLVKMYYAWGLTRTSSSTTPLKLHLIDPDGGEIESSPSEISFEPKGTNMGFSDGTYTFNGTLPGVSYTLENITSINFGFGDLILYYE